MQYLGGMSASSAHTVLDNCPFNEDSDVTISVSGESAPVVVKPTTSAAAVPSPVQSSRSIALVEPSSSSKPPKHAVAHVATTIAQEAITSALAAPSPVVRSSSSAAPPLYTSPSSVTSTSTASDSTSTTLRCDSATSFSLCGGGTCTAMGSVAAGTLCIDGEIVSASRMTKTKRSVGGKLAKRTAGGHFGGAARRAGH